MSSPDRTRSVSQRHLINAAFLSHVVPQPKSDKEAGEPDAVASWVDRFLVVERALVTEDQRLALMLMTRLADKRGGSVWEGYVAACEKYNVRFGSLFSHSIREEGQLTVRIRCSRASSTTRARPRRSRRSSSARSAPSPVRLSRTFPGRVPRSPADTARSPTGTLPDPTKASEDLMTFATQNVAQLYRELRALFDPQTDLRAYIKNSRDLLRRVEKFPHGDSCRATFDALLRLASYPLVNRSSIPQLLRRLTGTAGDDAAEWAASAARVLEYVSKSRPALYKSHVAELAKLLADQVPADEPIEGGTVASLVLHALARLKRDDESVAVEAKLAKKALAFASESRDEREAKHAATLVALDKGRPGALDDLVEVSLFPPLRAGVPAHCEGR